MKCRGFVSNIYVLLNTVTSFFMAGFLSTLVLAISNYYSIFLFALLFCLYALFALFLHYLRFPMAYKVFSANTEGIKLKKQFLKYSDIKEITVVHGYIKEWFGFRFLENLIGITQHKDIFIEDIICINCDFEGFNKKNKTCIYIPKTVKTDTLFRAYCEAYTSAESANSSNNVMDYNIPGYSFFTIINIVFCCLVFVGIPLLLVGSEQINVNPLILGTAFLGIVCFLLIFFKNKIAFHIKLFFVRFRSTKKDV